MVIVGQIELPYAFTMLMGRNDYGNPVSKGDQEKDFGDPTCTFKMYATQLKLEITGLLPQAYRGGSWARGGGIDIYFYHNQENRRDLRALINSCARIHPTQRTTLRDVPDPIPFIHEDGVNLAVNASGGITRILVSSESELQSRGVPPIDIIAEANDLPLFLELEAPDAGNRIHLGGRFWKPFYTQTFLTSITPQTPVLHYGITIHIPFEDEYSQFINGMLVATA